MNINLKNVLESPLIRHMGDALVESVGGVLPNTGEDAADKGEIDPNAPGFVYIHKLKPGQKAKEEYEKAYERLRKLIPEDIKTLWTGSFGLSSSCSGERSESSCLYEKNEPHRILIDTRYDIERPGQLEIRSTYLSQEQIARALGG